MMTDITCLIYEFLEVVAFGSAYSDIFFSKLKLTKHKTRSNITNPNRQYQLLCANTQTGAVLYVQQHPGQNKYIFFFLRALADLCLNVKNFSEKLFVRVQMYLASNSCLNYLLLSVEKTRSVELVPFLMSHDL